MSNVTVTMTDRRLGEDGSTWWEIGESYSATEYFARQLVAMNAATATFIDAASDGWEDLRFPVQGINPAGTTAPPTLDEALDGFSGTLLFAGNAENVIAGVAQMPHGWKKGTAIRPHIHWSKPTGSSNAVAWEFYYRHLGFPSDVAADWVGPVAMTIVACDQTTSNSHIISSAGDISMTGKRESSVLCWQVRRQGATDADNGTARLYEFDIHYISDKRGTPFEIPGA